MSETQRWFEEAEKELKIFTWDGESCVMYKGFKITKSGSGYKIEDIRFSNMYDAPSKISLGHFKRFGFIKGADIIGFKRETKRIETYKKKIEVLYEKRKKFKKEMSKDRRLNTKRIRNINKHID